jgi:hypothetical protein
MAAAVSRADPDLKCRFVYITLAKLHDVDSAIFPGMSE